MPADVRIEIENYEGEAPPVEDKVLFIVLGIARDAAEDALTRL